jgi:CDP-glycerol glycerophosphotransferase (TagB/SpsB family)
VSNQIEAIYLPTLRGEPYSEFKILNGEYVDLQKINDKLCESNIRLSLKLHPANKLPKSTGLKIAQLQNIKIIDLSVDINKILYDYDILITDFSGVLIDFVLTGRPIINFIPDLMDYSKNDKGLYYSQKDFVVGYLCEDWDSVLSTLVQLKSDGHLLITDNIRYTKLRDKFHIYKDGASSERAWCEIERFNKGA